MRGFYGGGLARRQQPRSGVSAAGLASITAGLIILELFCMKLEGFIHLVQTDEKFSKSLFITHASIITHAVFNLLSVNFLNA